MRRSLVSLLSVLIAATALAADKLPVVSITTNTPLNAQKKVTARMKAGSYDGYIGIKLRGNSSLSFNQKKYTIELRDADGNEVDAPLMDMPAHSKWVLLAPYNDVSMVRDPLAFQLWRDMGHWGPRTKMVELNMDGEYRGIYILSEAIKRGAERVDVAKLKKTDVAGRELTGGYILRIDTYNEDDATFPSKVPGIGDGIMTSQITWSCIYPKKKNLQPEQLSYIEQFVDSMELTIQSDHFTDPRWGYERYIDVGSFVDYFIHSELSLNADGYKRSAYFYKEKVHEDGTGGKLFAGPVWDYNLAYGNCNFCNDDNTQAWCYEGCNTQPTPAFWQRLLQDPAFRKAVKKRYQELRKGVLSNKQIFAYIDRHAKLIEPYQAQHFEKYPELLVSEERKEQLAQQPSFSFPQMPSGGFGGGFPGGFGGFPQMDLDSIPSFPGGFPGGFGGFPGGFPQMNPDSIPHFPSGFGGFPQMNFDSIPMFPGRFPAMPQNFDMSQFGDFGDFSNFGGFEGFGGFGDPVGMFAAYRVSSYQEEIKVLKQWLTDRLAFLDREINRFDKDFEPRVQELREMKMPTFEGGFPFAFPTQGF